MTNYKDRLLAPLGDSQWTGGKSNIPPKWDTDVSHGS